ncbi:MAG: choice-of-anchor D domain-containing protein [Betaproteobacteria bacterium]
MNARLAALVFAALTGLGVAQAQDVIIGDATNQTVSISAGTTPYNTLILGNQPLVVGTLTFSGGTINVTHSAPYSGFVTVGNGGIGVLNQSNADGDAVITITGPQYIGPPPATPPDPWGGYLFIGRRDGSVGNYSLTDTGSGFDLQLNVQNEIQIGGSNVSTDPGGGFSCFATCTGSFVQGGGTVTAGGVTLGIGTGTGTYTINSGTLNANLDLGNTSAGDNRFTQNGGTVNAGGMFIANGGGSNGTYTLNDGILNSGSFASIGLQGTGTLEQNSGVHNAGDVSLGYQSTGTGTYNLNGGTLNVGTTAIFDPAPNPSDPPVLRPGTGTGSLLVGDTGTGTFTMTGGTLNILNDYVGINAFVVGNNVGSVGTFTQSGGVVEGGRSLTIGQNGGTGTYNLNTDLVNATIPTLTTGFIALGNNSGQGTFNQQDGTVNNTYSLFVGSQGTYNLQGGSLNVTANEAQLGQGTVVGTSGTGALFNQTGGTQTTNYLIVGNRNDASGTYVMTAGDLVINTRLFVGLGDDGPLNPTLLNGLFQQSGGTVTTQQMFIGGFTEFIPDPIDPINNPPTIIQHLGTGRYDLSGGTVNSNFTVVGDSAQGAVVQTGGIFNAGELQIGAAGLFSITQGANTYFYSSGTYDLQSGQLNTTGTTVGLFGQGTFNQSGGDHNVTGNLVVGSAPGLTEPNSGQVRQGVYNLTDGNVTVSGLTLVGAGNGVGLDPGFLGEPGAMGTFTQSGGTHTVGGDLIIGQAGSQGGGTGLYQMSGGALTVNGQLTVGDGGNTVAGSGTFIQSGGLVTANALVVGSNGGSSTVIGTYTLNAGDVVVTDLVPFGGVTYIGGFAAGTMTQNGGTFTSNFINIGILGDSHGTYILNNGTVTANENLGVGGNGTGTFVQNGGQVAVNSSGFGMYVGGNIGGFATPGSTGSYTLNNGSLTVANNLFLGTDGPGTFTQTGGTVVIGADSLASGPVSTQLLNIGANANGNGTYNISGGSLTVYGNAAFNNAAMEIGSSGVGKIVQSGGSVTTWGADGFAIGEFGGSGTGSGQYDLSGGTLTTMRNPTNPVDSGNGFVGAHSLGTMNQTGGTVSVAGALFVGYNTGGPGGGGFYNQSAGSVTVGDYLSIGTFAGSSGAYNLTGTGTLHVAGDAYIGEEGVATFTQGTGTSNTVVGDLTIGRFNVTTGSTYTQNGGLLTTGRSIVGEFVVGTFTQNGGTHNVTNSGSGDLIVGFVAGSDGTYNMNAGTLNVANRTIVGDGGTGTFTQSAGVHTTPLLILGAQSSGVGTYNLNGGTLNDSLIVGDAGTGTFNNTAGTHNVAGFITLGNQATGVGNYNLSGTGILAVTGTMNVGDAGTGTFAQSGGTASVTGGVQIANQAGSTGTLNLSGGALSAASMSTNAGGAATGTLNYSGGTLTLGGGTGTVTNNAGGEVNFSGSGTRVLGGNLTNSGVVNLATNAQVNVLAQTGGTISLGANNLNVTKDYTNTNFGTGNSFNARAGVTGAGQIVGVDAAQTITATGNPGNLTGGSNTWTLDLGNVRGGGSTTVNYQIANNGTGADIRGAVQTGAPGAGSITDSRLSGTGATAGNFGALAAGASTGNLGVTFNATSGGSLAGQSIAVVSNFGNVATQTINLTGTATVLAQGSATPNSDPVTLGNFHVGGTPSSQNFAVQNTTSGAGAERLGVGSANTTGNFASTNNLGAGFIAGGASNASAVNVAVSGGVAGLNTGSVTLQYTTNGQLIDASFGTINANSQTINLAANGYALASGNISSSTTINFGTVQVGQVVSNQNLTIANTASGPAGFVEMLDAAFGTPTDNRIVGAGSISLLAAGGSSTAMSIGLNTNIGAGVVNGTIAVNYVSNGLGTSGLGTTAVGSQDVTVNGDIQFVGNVVLQANPSAHTPEPVNLGNVRINGAFGTQALSITNIQNLNNDPQAALNASISGNAPVTASGSFNLLGPGQTDNSNLVVGLAAGTSATAGMKSGTATIALVSDASNIGGCGANCQVTLPSQTVNVQGNVYQAATGNATPSPATVANQRVGGSNTTALAVTNTASGPAGFVEDLNATFGANTGAALSGGSIAGRLAGTNNTGTGSMAVRVDTSTAGAKFGTVTLNYETAGAVGGVSNGLGTAAANTQVINVSGDVYRLANPTINTASPITLAARVGDASPNAAISITNTSPDQYTEGLNVTRGTTPAGFGSSGSITNLIAGGTDASSLKVSLNTGTAGSFGGTQVLQFASNGTITSNSDMALADGGISLSGNVYTKAVAQVTTATPINLGIVHVGDTAPQAAVAVKNNAAVTALNDSLTMNFASATGPFTGSGDLGTGGLAAQASNASGLKVGMNTSAAGTFIGTANFNAFSHDDELSDLALADVVVDVTGQVNNYAVAALHKNSGTGTFSGGGISYLLDFNNVFQNSGNPFANLGVFNDIFGPADLLSGLFDLSGVDDFLLTGFNVFGPLGAGAAYDGLDVSFATATLGLIQDVITLHWYGSNESGYVGDDETITLTLRANIVEQGNHVPEPGTLALLLVGLLTLVYGAYRPRRRARH